jgi:prolyl-tRNA editing enzyme YbaK/EbsC (Cys-tRNA(Pro) deacylase)
MHPRSEEFAAAASERYGFSPDVHEFPEGTKTAQDAADAIGCEVAQIASAIALDVGGEVVVSLTSGANRVDFARIAALRGVSEDAVSMADPEPIKETLGWAIGGVPPICHATAVPVYLDETLTGFEEVWAAAGTPSAVFPISPDRLVELSGAEVAQVVEG